MTDTVAVDDSDSRVKFTGGWFVSGGSNEFASTTHGTRAAGQTATFTFTGSYVAVYGTISDTGAYKDPPVSTYSIDGSTPYTYTADATSKVQYKQRFFASPKLSDGQHTLIVTSTRANAFFWIDYLEYTPSAEDKEPPVQPAADVKTIITTAVVTPDTKSAITTKNDENTPVTSPAIPSTTPIPNSKASSSTKSDQTKAHTTVQEVSGHTVTLTLDTSSSTTGPPSLGTSDPATSSDLPSSSKSGAPLGAIIGGAVGGVVIIILLVLALLLCRRRRKAAAAIAIEGEPSTGITPFMASASMMEQTYNQGNQSDSSGAFYGIGHSYLNQGGKARGMHRSQPSGSGTSSTTGLLNTQSDSDSRDTSTVSSANAGIVPLGFSKATDYGGAAVVRAPESQQPPAGPSGGMHSRHQSFGIGPLYEDTPPAYIQSPPGPRGPI